MARFRCSSLIYKNRQIFKQMFSVTLTIQYVKKDLEYECTVLPRVAISGDHYPSLSGTAKWMALIFSIPPSNILEVRWLKTKLDSTHFETRQITTKLMYARVSFLSGKIWNNFDMYIQQTLLNMDRIQIF